MAQVLLRKLMCCMFLLVALVISMSFAAVSFGQQYAVTKHTVLSYSWKYWEWTQTLDVHFRSNIPDDHLKIMDVRVNYNEGCLTSECAQVSLLSLEMVMENVNVISKNDSLIAFKYNLGDLMNVDPATLELRITNLFGNVTLASFKVDDWYEIFGYISMDQILDGDLNSIAITLVGNRLPSKFKFKMGELVQVNYRQQNSYYIPSVSQIDLTFKSEEQYSYSLVNSPKNLNDYYRLACSDNIVYKWFDVISLITQQEFSNPVRFTYNSKSTTDYFGNSLETANLLKMNMFQHGRLVGNSVSEGVFNVENFNFITPNFSLYIVAPIENLDYSKIQSNGKIEGSVTKGNFKIYNVKLDFDEKVKLLNFEYQITSKDSMGYFSILPVSNSDEICPRYSYPTQFYDIPYSENEKSKVFSKTADKNYFSIIVGCTSNNECNYSFRLSLYLINPITSPKKNNDGIDLVPIIVPIVVVSTWLIISVMVLIGIVMIIRRKKAQTKAYHDLSEPINNKNRVQ